MGNHRLETDKISHLFLLFVLPAVISMVLAGIQSVVDGIFLGRYSTTNAMASVTIAIPYMQMIIGCTMIVCSGTLSYLGRTLGEKKASSIRKAQDIFFSSFLALCVASIFLMIIGTFADEWLATIMGANQVLLKDTSQYVFVIALFSPSIALMLLFGLTGRLLGKPNLILYCTVICVLANIFLDG